MIRMMLTHRHRRFASGKTVEVILKGLSHNTAAAAEGGKWRREEEGGKENFLLSFKDSSSRGRCEILPNPKGTLNVLIDL